MKAVHLLAACFVLFALFLAGCNRDAGKPGKDHPSLVALATHQGAGHDPVARERAQA